jgi:hypothetical protein
VQLVKKKLFDLKILVNHSNIILRINQLVFTKRYYLLHIHKFKQIKKAYFQDDMLHLIKAYIYVYFSDFGVINDGKCTFKGYNKSANKAQTR